MVLSFQLLTLIKKIKEPAPKEVLANPVPHKTVLLVVIFAAPPHLSIRVCSSSARHRQASWVTKIIDFPRNRIFASTLGERDCRNVGSSYGQDQKLPFFDGAGSVHYIVKGDYSFLRRCFSFPSETRCYQSFCL